MNFLITLAGAGMMLTSASVWAQDAQGPNVPETEPAPMPEPIQIQDIPPAATPVNPTNPDMAAPTFTDEKIAGFASAAMQMRELRSDTALNDIDRRARAELIIAGEGLDPQTYSAIGAAAASDPAIAVRVQQAIEEMAAEPEG